MPLRFAPLWPEAERLKEEERVNLFCKQHDIPVNEIKNRVIPHVLDVRRSVPVAFTRQGAERSEAHLALCHAVGALFILSGGWEKAGYRNTFFLKHSRTGEILYPTSVEKACSEEPLIVYSPRGKAVNRVVERNFSLPCDQNNFSFVDTAISHKDDIIPLCPQNQQAGLSPCSVLAVDEHGAAEIFVAEGIQGKKFMNVRERYYLCGPYLGEPSVLSSDNEAIEFDVTPHPKE